MTKSAKSTTIEAEIVKAKAKLAEQQSKVKELEQKRTEYENMEIVEIVRGFNVPLNELAEAIARARGGAPQRQPAPELSPEMKEDENE